MLTISMPDGDARALSVRDRESGVDLTRTLDIARISLKIEAGGPVCATLEIEVVDLREVEADPARARWVARNPQTGRAETLRALEFDNGLRVEFHGGVPVARHG